MLSADFVAETSADFVDETSADFSVSDKIVSDESNRYILAIIDHRIIVQRS